MGNCRSISQPSRREAARCDAGVPGEGLLQGLCRGLRRCSAEVGVTRSSFTDSPGHTEDRTTTAAQPLPMASTNETPKVKPVTFGKNKVELDERRDLCQQEEQHRLASVALLFSVERSLVALRDGVNEDKSGRVIHTTDNADAESNVGDSRTTVTVNDGGYTPMYTTVSSLVAMFEDDGDDELTTETKTLLSDDTEDKTEQKHDVEKTEELHTGSTAESHVPLCDSVSPLIAIYEEESCEDVTDYKDADSADVTKPATSAEVKKTRLRSNCKAGEHMASSRHIDYPKLPGITLPPRNLEQVVSKQMPLPGDVGAKQNNLKRTQGYLDTVEDMYINTEMGKMGKPGEEVTDMFTGETSQVVPAENILPNLRTVTGLTNDCTRAHTSTETDAIGENNTRAIRPSLHCVDKMTFNADKNKLLPLIPIDNKKADQEVQPTLEVPREIVFERKKRACSFVEEEVALTVVRSLALIKEHTGKRDCAVPLYVRPADNGLPKLVTIRASKKQIKDGSAKRQILQSRSVTKMTHEPMISLTRKTSKKHIGCSSGLVDGKADSCHRWLQREGSSMEARIPTVPQFYECQKVVQNARERLGLARLQKYNITVQCRAIERIKTDEDEFPGILPESLKRRWRKKINEQKAHTIN